MMSVDYMPFAYFGEEILPFHQATVSIASNSLQYGTTCFTGIRGYLCDGEARIFRLKDHHERLMQSSKMMGFDFYLPWSEFLSAISRLIQANAPKSDFYIRPFLYTRDLGLAPKSGSLRFELAIYLVPLISYYDPNKGLRLMISSWRKFSDASLPTKAKAGGCYINSFLATNEARRAGYDEALLLDQQGNIVEASVANLLVMYRDRIITPSIGSARLEGITLRTAMTLLQDEGLTVCFDTVDRSMVYGADELILTGTAVQFAFAASVDERSIGPMDTTRQEPGPICQLLRHKLAQVMAMEHPQSEKWIVRIRIGHE
jgi:branched-chain amino acid aminotransferase